MSVVRDALSSVTDNAAVYREAAMGKSAPSMPVMALGALVVFAIAATVLYLGVRAPIDSPTEISPSMPDDTDAASHAGAKAGPGDAQEWLALAAARRRNRDYAGAREA